MVDNLENVKMNSKQTAQSLKRLKFAASYQEMFR